MDKPTIAQVRSVTKKLRECSVFLEAHGLRLETWIEDRWINFESIALLGKGRNEFLASLCGVTVQQYRTFWSHDWQCRAKTRRGRRCSNLVSNHGRMDPCGSTEVWCPADFNPSDLASRFCQHHGGGELQNVGEVKR